MVEGDTDDKENDDGGDCYTQVTCQIVEDGSRYRIDDDDTHVPQDRIFAGEDVSYHFCEGVERVVVADIPLTGIIDEQEPCACPEDIPDDIRDDE